MGPSPTEKSRAARCVDAGSRVFVHARPQLTVRGISFRLLIYAYSMLSPNASVFFSPRVALGVPPPPRARFLPRKFPRLVAPMYSFFLLRRRFVDFSLACMHLHLTYRRKRWEWATFDTR